jgi:hypothetical protein
MTRAGAAHDHVCLACGLLQLFPCTCASTPLTHVMQMHTKSRAKKLGLAESDLKLPVAVSLSASSTRERDWANVATAHQGDPTAYTWLLAKYRCVVACLHLL